MSNARKQDHGLRLEALVDSSCEGGSYIGLKLWFLLCRWRPLHVKMLSYGSGLPNVAESANAEVLLMQVFGWTKLSFLFPPEAKVFTLPDAQMFGTSALRFNHRAISVAPNKIFQPESTSTCVPFLERHRCPHVSPLARRFCVVTEQADHPQPQTQEPKPLSVSLVAVLPSPDSLAFETGSSGEWDASLKQDTLIGVASDCDRDGVHHPEIGNQNHALFSSPEGPEGLAAGTHSSRTQV